MRVSDFSSRLRRESESEQGTPSPPGLMKNLKIVIARPACGGSWRSRLYYENQARLPRHRRGGLTSAPIDVVSLAFHPKSPLL